MHACERTVVVVVDTMDLCWFQDDENGGCIVLDLVSGFRSRPNAQTWTGFDLVAMTVAHDCCLDPVPLGLPNLARP
jgi:hypothetical protein